MHHKNIPKLIWNMFEFLIELSVYRLEVSHHTF